MEHFNAGGQPENFPGSESFVELGHFNKLSVKNTRLKSSLGNILEFFLLDTLKNYILKGKFNPKMDTIRTFFPKSRHFFDFQ